MNQQQKYILNLQRKSRESDVLSLDDIVRLHPTLHKADESRFVDVYDEQIGRAHV